MADQKPYITIDVNGVRVTLCFLSWFNRQKHKSDDVMIISRDLVCTTRLNVDDLVKLAGVKDTFDYAVPQDWLDDRRRRGDKNNYIWVYSKGELFGHPVSYWQLREDAKKNIFTEFLRSRQPLEV